MDKMRGDKDNALECNWERDDCDGHTSEWPHTLCDDCLVDFTWEIEADDEVYIIEHEDYSIDFDLAQCLWIRTDMAALFQLLQDYS
tara:strand:+ start:550 stop:807 length:258 start_codon:yes stop_codon:yes gene_type:complete